MTERVLPHTLDRSAPIACSGRGVADGGFRFRDLSAAPAMAVRSLGPPTTMSFRLAIGLELWQGNLQKEGEPMSSAQVSLITTIVRRSGAMSLKPC